MSIGLETADRIRQEVARRLAVDPTLAWERFPNSEELSMIAEIVFTVRRASELGSNTAKQLAYYISRLSHSETMRVFFIEYDQKYKGDPENYDTIFRFLRACEYGLPQILSVIEIFVRKRHPSTNYRHFINELSHWFRPPVLRELDEEGIPIQISERFTA
ncbi:hypothetical protein [Ancylobacter dichloromethanicus]|uniref:hypothetical protein n=1 Tax=Ancylobacter dichloromethanicus TaxID=518825 RepID=UPI003619973B